VFPDVCATGIMTGLFFALVGLVYEKAHSREIFKMGGFATMMPGIATAFTIGGLSSLGLPATAGFVRRVPSPSSAPGVPSTAGGCSRRCWVRS
jgi:NADH:ubiquinone oxidoreductase subunit 4 (subunit M)